MFLDIPNKDGVWLITSSSVWNKPAEYTSFMFLVVGGGGGGGSGWSNPSGNNRPGGGGGGGGGVCTTVAPGFLLPDTLFITIGRGGSGGTVGANNAGNGGTTYVSAYPSTSANDGNILFYADGGISGKRSTTSNLASFGGSGGVGFITYLAAGTAFTGSGSGTNGGNPVGGGAGVALSDPFSFVMGGTGGASTPLSNANFAGGLVTASDIYPQINGGAAGGGAGADGFFIKRPLTIFGGTGGGSIGFTGTAGKGGNGILGSGGGGGGAGVTGAVGGRGGDGFVLIIGY